MGRKRTSASKTSSLQPATHHQNLEKAEPRESELKRLLERRRDELAGRLRRGVRAAQAERELTERKTSATDDSPDCQSDDDVEIVLIHLISETLRRLDVALRRLEQGAYGNCAECGEPIALARLEALPFAIRCLQCEAAQEAAQATRDARKHRTTWPQWSNQTE